jgi:hypothetical protein
MFLVQISKERDGVPEEPLRAAIARVDAAKEVFGSVEYLEGRVLVGGRYELEDWISLGKQECPWGPNIASAKPDVGVRLCGRGSSEWTIGDVVRGLEMRGPSLITHLIRVHGFFEGLQSPYRVDPRALAQLLQLGPFALSA